MDPRNIQNSLTNIQVGLKLQIMHILLPARDPGAIPSKLTANAKATRVQKTARKWSVAKKVPGGHVTCDVKIAENYNFRIKRFGSTRGAIPCGYPWYISSARGLYILLHRPPHH